MTFYELPELPPQLLADGYLARAVHGERLTMAVVEVEPEALLPQHEHENEQLGMVVRGSLIIRIGEEERKVGPGGMWKIPSDTPHSVVAGEKGAAVIDIFSPPREDWAANRRLAPREPSWP